MQIPLLFTVENKKIVIVGGGRVALRKAKKLLEYDAYIECVSVHHLSDFFALQNIHIIEHPYAKQYIEGALFVIAATSDPLVNHQVLLDCREVNIPCCVVDQPHISDFIFPASFHRGDLTFAVSTGGNSPVLSKKIIQDLRRKFDESYGERIELLGKIRRWIIENEKDETYKNQMLQDIAEYDLAELYGLYCAMTDKEEV